MIKITIYVESFGFILHICASVADTHIDLIKHFEEVKKVT